MRVAPFLLLVLVLVGCGSKDEGYAEAASASAPMEATKAKADFAASAASPARVADKAGEGMRLATNETPAVPRMIVRNAELTLRVGDVQDVETKVGQTARSVGGMIEASQGTDLAGPTPSLSITLRVPEGRFDEALRRLEGLGTRLGKTIATDDVTAQAVDMDARLRSLRVQEDAYRAILGAARKISDVLEVQERLTGVRTQIEQIVAQRRGLSDQAARSKIVVTLTQSLRPESPAPEPDWMAQTWGDATGSLRAFGRSLASFGLWAVAMLPVWLPLTLLAIFVARRWRAAGA